ncbi:MAG: hypothetical protein ACPG8A_03380 [Psychrobium sp.]
MSIIGNNIVLPSGSTSGGVTFSAIGFKTILPISVATNAQEDSEYPFSNVLDYRDNTKYSPSIDSGSVTITLTQGNLSEVDYYGIAVHNGGSASLYGTFEVFKGGLWVQVDTFAASGDNKTIMGYFGGVTCQKQRITLNFSEKLYIGAMNIGKSWSFDCSPDVGFTPAYTNNIDKVEQFTSENGQFIISRRLEKGFSQKGSFSFLDWEGDNRFDSEYIDYMNHVKDSKPFFMKWNVENNQAFYGQQNPNNLTAPKYDTATTGSFNFDLKGRD